MKHVLSVQVIKTWTPCVRRDSWANDSLHCHIMYSSGGLGRELWWLKGDAGREDFKEKQKLELKEICG